MIVNWSILVSHYPKPPGGQPQRDFYAFVGLIFWPSPVLKGQFLKAYVFHPAIGNQSPSRGMNASNSR
jgi:hypothetical protein